MNWNALTTVFSFASGVMALVLILSLIAYAEEKDRRKIIALGIVRKSSYLLTVMFVCLVVCAGHYTS